MQRLDAGLPVSFINLHAGPGINMGRIYVKVNPSDARIRIMKIRPIFRQGIELRPGNYELVAIKNRVCPGPVDRVRRGRAVFGRKNYTFGRIKQVA